MRRFLVFAGCNCHGSKMTEHIIEMPDGASEEDCEAACSEALDDMIGTEFDTGWNEVSPDDSEA